MNLPCAPGTVRPEPRVGYTVLATATHAHRAGEHWSSPLRQSVMVSHSLQLGHLSLIIVGRTHPFTTPAAISISLLCSLRQRPSPL